MAITTDAGLPKGALTVPWRQGGLQPGDNLYYLPSSGIWQLQRGGNWFSFDPKAPDAVNNLAQAAPDLLNIIRQFNPAGSVRGDPSQWIRFQPPTSPPAAPPGRGITDRPGFTPGPGTGGQPATDQPAGPAFVGGAPSQGPASNPGITTGPAAGTPISQGPASNPGFTPGATPTPGPGTGGQPAPGGPGLATGEPISFDPQQLITDFVEGNWDVAFGALVNTFRAQGAAFAFLDWLTRSSGRYELQYLGALGQQALKGQIPTQSVVDMLNQISGGSLGASPQGVPSSAGSGPFAQFLSQQAAPAPAGV